MNVSILPRRPHETIEDSIQGVDTTLREFGLIPVLTLEYVGLYREVTYESPSNGGLRVQYRLDESPKIPFAIGKISGDSNSGIELPKTFEADNIIYSIGIDDTLYGLIGKQLSSHFGRDIPNITVLKKASIVINPSE